MAASIETILGQEGTWMGSWGGIPHLRQALTPLDQKEVQLGKHTLLTHETELIHSETFVGTFSSQQQSEAVCGTAEAQPLHDIPRAGQIENCGQGTEPQELPQLYFRKNEGQSLLWTVMSFVTHTVFQSFSLSNSAEHIFLK